jgi:N-acetylglucosaminyl-diphospho-decaprenol L-rhamnosyltransferase
MKLLVVIVNYRTAELTIDCLRSLEPELRPVRDAHVVVADNDSQDGSAEKIRGAIESNGWSSWCELMPLAKNGGFAWGNNQGIEPFLNSPDKPDYVYLLNPDTIVLPDAVISLVRFLDDHPQVGVAGGRAVNSDGTVRNSAFRFHSVLGELEGALRLRFVSKMLSKWVVASPPPDVPAPVDWVSGASMMIRRQVFERIGMLDDRYFMYYEETDFCLRAARVGWTCWYVPASKIVHLVGQSSGVTGARRMARRRPKYWFDSRHRFFRLHYGVLATFAADLLWAIGFCVSSVVNALRGKPRSDPPWLLWDFIRYNVTSWGHRL